MLPDYSDTKRLFGRLFQTYARRKMKAISPFVDVQTRLLHEGRGMKMLRADQSQSKAEVQQVTSTMEIKFNEIPDLTLEKTIAKYDTMIFDMVRQQTGLALDQLSTEIPQKQSVNAKGKKLNAELILDILETIQLEFYPDGRPHELVVIGELFTPEQMQVADEEIRTNPKLKKRHDEMMARKREEWRAREASRKLVG